MAATSAACTALQSEDPPTQVAWWLDGDRETIEGARDTASVPGMSGTDGADSMSGSTGRAFTTYHYVLIKL
jgi:hypothetical protein